MRAFAPSSAVWRAHERDGMNATGDLWVPILLYATAIDTKQFEQLMKAFHPDVVADYGENEFRGAAAITERMIALHRHIIGSRHRLSNFRVVGRAAGAVQTETYVDALLVGGTPTNPLLYRDIGTYCDDLVQGEGGYVIRARRYERLWREGDVLALSAHVKEDPT